jgi:hypothetical protein
VCVCINTFTVLDSEDASAQVTGVAASTNRDLQSFTSPLNALSDSAKTGAQTASAGVKIDVLETPAALAEIDAVEAAYAVSV